SSLALTGRWYAQSRPHLEHSTATSAPPAAPASPEPSSSCARLARRRVPYWWPLLPTPGALIPLPAALSAAPCAIRPAGGGSPMANLLPQPPPLSPLCWPISSHPTSFI